MINTVDKNGDGKISFSEFRSELGLSYYIIFTHYYRVMMGGFPLLVPDPPAKKK